ncbi:MAG: hypothetical protein JNJ47_01080 [Alphaproteobacteria bacterium]|nr:hypothetical protein [Alphaproteobacteria bacterium]
MSNTEVICTMKKLFQNVDVEKCLTLFKKSIASLIIFSMLMSDVLNAMEDELEPTLVSQRIPSPKPSVPEKKVPINHDSSLEQEISIEIIEDSLRRQDSSSDETYSSTGSISSSPEKLTPENGKSLILTPADLSLTLAKLTTPPPSQPLEVVKSEPSPLPTPSGLTPESYTDFQPLATGPFELSKLVGADHGTSPTVQETSLLLQRTIDSGGTSSPMRAASLQDRAAVNVKEMGCVQPAKKIG